MNAARIPLALSHPAAADGFLTAVLSGDDLTSIGRLLGLHHRVRNQPAIVAAIEQMVAVRIVRDETLVRIGNSKTMQ
jgi:hypothetical protein